MRVTPADREAIVVACADDDVVIAVAPVAATAVATLRSGG